MLHERLRPLAIKAMPLAKAPPRKQRFGGPLALSRAHSVRPELVAEIPYMSWADDVVSGSANTRRFRDNMIDAEGLPRLTADDLKDIGVSAVGDRRRLLDAIAALVGAKSAAVGESGHVAARP
jgi:hypothetical protein